MKADDAPQFLERIGSGSHMIAASPSRVLELYSSPVRAASKAAHARATLRALLLCACWVPACAELLDLPENPHLAMSPDTPMDAGVPSVGRGIAAAREPGLESVPPGDEAAESPDLPLVAPGPLDASVGGRSEPVTGPEPRPATRAPDAGAPELPVEVPAGVTCAVDERPGPDGHCYFVLADLLSWDDARASCRGRAEGWDLASLRTEQESRFMADLIDGDAWFGATDEDLEGTWRWVDDGTAFWSGDGANAAPLEGAYSNWFDDEPNGEDSSNCARLLSPALATPTGALTWADLECEELRRAVCEGPAQ